MKIEQDVMVELSKLEARGNQVWMAQMDRALYLKVNKVLEALGGKWNRGKKSHLFDGDAPSLIDAAIVLGEVTTKRDINFFPTPQPLAARLVEEAGVSGGMLCLEPSAGTGRIAWEMLQRGAKVTCVERDQKMREKLAADGYDTSSVDDFLVYGDPLRAGNFDAIIMNPPFNKVGLGNGLDHAQHAYRLLRGGGILKCVLPSGVTFREDSRHKDFRSWVRQLDSSIDDLPRGSFKSSGTDVNTCVVTIRKAA